MLRLVLLLILAVSTALIVGCSTRNGLSSLSPDAFLPELNWGGPPRQSEPPLD
jgi:hypothetical protein